MGDAVRSADAIEDVKTILRRRRLSRRRAAALYDQLLAYHTALLKGSDVDQPRNLAKSVKVE